MLIEIVSTMTINEEIKIPFLSLNILLIDENT